MAFNILFIVIGAVGVFFNLQKYIKNEAAVKNGEAAQARVVDLKRVRNGRYILNVPTLEYRIGSETILTDYEDERWFFYRFTIGEEVTVHYYPSNPQKIYIKKGEISWPLLLAIFLLVIITVCAVVGF